jgi:ABC-type sugar transport system permease subunit
MLWTFQNPKNYYYLKSFFKHLKLLFKKIFFAIFFICFITSWIEIGNGKKMLFSYNLNIQILNQFSTTLENDFKKWLEKMTWSIET